MLLTDAHMRTAIALGNCARRAASACLAHLVNQLVYVLEARSHVPIDKFAEELYVLATTINWMLLAHSLL
jgi:hypothetical protein